MSFYDLYLEYKDFDFKNFFKNISENDVIRIINNEKLSELEFLVLLSDKAKKYLELMAEQSKKLTLQHFGRVIFLFTPMYLSNYCVNLCAYCGFNITNKINRKKLTLEEVEREAKAISSTGLKQILILCGGSRKHSSVSYIKKCIKILRKYFSSIAIEIYPLETAEYAELIEEGIDGLTLYQEVYNENTYDEVHIKGPKKDYIYRINAPERACRAFIRSVNIGVLLGLEDWRSEIFFTGLHANYLQRKYASTDISISLPRIRPHIGNFRPKCTVDDRNLVQIMLALRLFMPRAGITISTREIPDLRDNLLGLGVTKMSAGVSTQVGGHTLKEKSEKQFDISDHRSVNDIKKMLNKKGFQPVFKDWQLI